MMPSAACWAIPEEVSGLNVADWDAQWPVEELRAKFRDVVGKSAMFETLHRRRMAQLSMSRSAPPAWNMKGGTSFMLRRDITGRKQADEELRVGGGLRDA